MEINKELKFSLPRFIIILLLTLIGIGMCLELGYIFYKTNFIPEFTKSFCTVSELIDCDGVALTPYALTLGVPNALLGLILYVIVLMLLFVDRIQIAFKNTIFDVFKNPRSYIAVLGVISFIVSMILAFISIKVIHKICALCFCTYFINLFIAITARTKEGFISDFITTIIDFIDGVKKYFILFAVVMLGLSGGLYYLNDSLIFSPKLKQQRDFEEMMKSNKYAVKGNILGNENAKVVVNIYSDYNCPFCKIVNVLIHRASKDRNILVKEINYPLDTSCNKKIGGTLGGHETSCLYAKYALAAKKQGKFWGAANTLFYSEAQNADEIIEEFKKAKLGLDETQLRYDANSPEIDKELQDDILKTVEKNVMGTPAIEINGVLYVGAMPYEELLQKIDTEITRNK